MRCKNCGAEIFCVQQDPALMCQIFICHNCGYRENVYENSGLIAQTYAPSHGLSSNFEAVKYLLEEMDQEALKRMAKRPDDLTYKDAIFEVFKEMQGKI